MGLFPGGIASRGPTVRWRGVVQTLPDALASYVPVLVTRRLAEDPRPLTTPCSESFPAAVLCADISGFTAFTERLAREGPAGVEKVGAGLDGYFGRLTEIIAQHGGDVVKFAGDAVTAIWTLPPRDRTRDLQRVALPAIACGMAIQSALHGYRFTDGVELSLRVGLGASRIAAVHVGGLAGRWEVVLTGSALAQGLKAEALARPGEVVVAPQLWPLIAGHVRGEPAGAGFVRVHEIAGTITCTPLLRPAMPAEAEAALCGYVPVAVATRLAAGQRSWLAELRRVAVVFLHLPAVTYQTPLDEAQQVMVAVQQIVDSAEEHTNHVSVNNDGATVLIAFGLPPLAHEDDAVRAVGAAQQLRDVLGRLACPPRIGLVTGRAFCGSVGGADRCEYTLLGDVVNLAARLMQAADEARPILCDSRYTFASARAQFMFEAYPPIKAKGKTEAVAIYGPASGRLVARGGRLVARGAELGDADGGSPARAAAAGAGRTDARAGGADRQAARAAARTQRDGGGRGRGRGSASRGWPTTCSSRPRRWGCRS